MKKRQLSFYTNMPTPYQLDFFDSLSDLFDLQVTYFTNREKDRQWEFAAGEKKYASYFLKPGLLARLVQKRVTSFHFSKSIFRRAWKDPSPNIVVNGTYWSPNVVLLLIIGAIRKKEIVFWGEALFPAKSKLAHFVKYLLLSPVRLFTVRLFAIGKLAKESYLSYGYRKPIDIVPYNINADLFDKTFLNQEKLNRLQAIFKSKNELVFLSSGSLIPRKGMDTLITAFLKILPKVNARLMILGDGPELSQLKLLAAPAKERVDFLGFKQKDDVPYYFNVADVFVFASKYDGWGLVINEAVSAGLPIISSDKVGAAADQIIDGYNGMICSADDPDEFAEAMLKIAEDEYFKKCLTKNSAHMRLLMSSPFNAQKVYEVFDTAQ